VGGGADRAGQIRVRRRRVRLTAMLCMLNEARCLLSYVRMLERPLRCHEVLCRAQNVPRRGVLIDDAGTPRQKSSGSTTPLCRSQNHHFAISRTALDMSSVPHVHRRSVRAKGFGQAMDVGQPHLLAPPSLLVRHAQLSSQVIDMACSAQ
jgi:hypothetical protein